MVCINISVSTDAIKKEKQGSACIAYMDETWVWRYHSRKTGIGPKGVTRQGTKSSKGDRLIIVDAITSDGAIRWQLENEKGKLWSTLWSFLYTKSGDYHTAMNFESFQKWINCCFVPTWKRKYPRTPCILVLDNAPYHMGGMINPHRLSKSECTLHLRKCLPRGSRITVNRNGTLLQFEVPRHGGFPNSPAGPSLRELQEAVHDILADYKPRDLLTWVECRFAELGWEVIFTPPYMCNFQPIELYWANIKNSIGRRYFSGRDMKWIQHYFKKHSITIECDSLVRHAHDCMNIWLRQDNLLGGVYDNVTVPDDDIRENILANNPKFMSEKEMEDIQNPSEVAVHFTIHRNGDMD